MQLEVLICQEKCHTVIPQYSSASELIKPCTRHILTRKKCFSTWHLLGTCCTPQEKTLHRLVLVRFGTHHEFQNELTTSTRYHSIYIFVHRSQRFPWDLFQEVKHLGWEAMRDSVTTGQPPARVLYPQQSGPTRVCICEGTVARSFPVCHTSYHRCN